MSQEERLGRRRALVGLGASALGATAAGAITLGGRPTTSEHSDAAAPEVESAEAESAVAVLDAPVGLSPVDDAVRALFGELADGGMLADRWRVESVHAVRLGAVPVKMSTPSGQRFMVEVFRDTPDGPPPIARAGGLAFCIYNHGRGAMMTGEDAGLGVRALSNVLGARRQAGAPMPAALMSHAERMAQPHGVFDVPV